jgi:N6-adenosine-specific RNA methylase IME4
MSYHVLLADPPWHHDRDHRSLGRRTAASFYPTMKLDALKAMRPLIDGWAARDCALFLWTTHSHQFEAADLIRAWGFIPNTTAFVWIKRTTHGKVQFGMGSTTRSGSELCLLGKRRRPRRKDKGVREVIETEVIDARLGGHSQKPDEQYARIEALYDGPYLELFARQRWAGWDAWGLEAPASVTHSHDIRNAACLGCGQALDGMRRDVRYCSSACKQRAYRARRAP